VILEEVRQADKVSALNFGLRRLSFILVITVYICACRFIGRKKSLKSQLIFTWLSYWLWFSPNNQITQADYDFLLHFKRSHIVPFVIRVSEYTGERGSPPCASRLLAQCDSRLTRLVFCCIRNLGSIELLPFWNKLEQEFSDILPLQRIHFLSKRTYILPSQKVAETRPYVWNSYGDPLEISRFALTSLWLSPHPPAPSKKKKDNGKWKSLQNLYNSKRTVTHDVNPSRGICAFEGAIPSVRLPYLALFDSVDLALQHAFALCFVNFLLSHATWAVFPPTLAPPDVMGSSSLALPLYCSLILFRYVPAR